MRGVDSAWRRLTSPNSGLSPLARGGRRSGKRRGQAWRVIPACAGWTPHGRTARLLPPGYPRLRGVDLYARQQKVDTHGLSPLARGGRHTGQRRPTRQRVIPACAGWTCSPRFAIWRSAGYPRLRGVDAKPELRTSEHYGLSPLARVIPACAGWTDSVKRPDPGVPGYPRLRGVDSTVGSGPVGTNGLSPLARGGQRLPHTHREPKRVIPACAGWTFAVSAECPADAGYPRLRGVDRGFEVFGNRIHGLSPLARGGRSYGLSAAFSRRVIPACAGWTSTGTGCASKAAGYPRLRGVDLADEARDDAVAGLSPLARGGHTER